MTRRTCFRLWFAALLPRIMRGAPRGEEFVVIVHPSNRFDSLTRAQLRFLFLRKVSRWPWGAQVEPIDLPLRTPSQEAFVRQIMGTTEERLMAYWIDQRTSAGLTPPVEVNSAQAAKSIVASRQGAIAYIPDSALDATVKAVAVRS